MLLQSTFFSYKVIGFSIGLTAGGGFGIDTLDDEPF